MNDYESYYEKRRRKRVKRTVSRIVIMVVTVLLILGFAWLITVVIQRSTSDSSAPSTPGSSAVGPASSQSSAPPESDASPAASGSSDASGDSSAWNHTGSVPQSGEEEGEIIEPDYRMIALPENGRVDMSYFDTVTFVGDSITQGLELYKTQGIPNAHYCAYKGVGPKQIYDGSAWPRLNGEREVPMDALVASQPDNVYILLGTNAMVGIADDEVLLAYFSEMLDAVKANLDPAVGIYLQSITPVLPDTPRFDIARIQGLNNALAKMAYEKDIYFVDINETLADSSGYLKEEYGSQRDGYHLTPDGYSAWVEYLVTHTAYHPRNPYLEGSTYYTPPEESGDESAASAASDASSSEAA